MSGKEMASDINKAIASGGYVIVPEKAVDGTGRNAIYVYMTYNGQTGAQGWKISGGLNGDFFEWIKNGGWTVLVGFGISVIAIFVSGALAIVLSIIGALVSLIGFWTATDCDLGGLEWLVYFGIAIAAVAFVLEGLALFVALLLGITFPVFIPPFMCPSNRKLT